MSTVLKQHYAEMVSSSVDWAGATPSHWEIQRLGRLFRESSQRAISKAELEYPILSVSIHDGISDKEMNEEELDRKVTRSDDRSLYKVVEENDLAYNMMRAWQGGFGAAQVNGLISPAYVVCKPRTSLPSRYFELLLRTPTAVTELKRFSRGITDFRLRLYWDDFKKIEVAVPPEREQNQILAFLDYETAKIDGLIEKQQQLIALLGEKRQAVISHAVTKGLNPDAPMRDSGIEWLGEVPEHWTVCRLKHVISFLTSGPRGWSDLISDEGESVFLQSGDLNDELGLRLKTAQRLTPPSNAERVRTRMRDGDVVVCVTGANTGRVAFASELSQTVFVNQHLALVRPMLGVANPCFLATLLSSTSTRNYFAVKQYGLKEGLSLTNVAETPVCIPPLNEQVGIVEHLLAIESRMKRLREIADDQVDLLQERRTALISAAVTGKIDVRGWKPPSSARMPETEMEVA